MKSFSKILSEVAQPKSSEEKAFKDMHTYETPPHPVALPHQHTGDIGAEGLPRAKAARKADQDGDAAYDQAYNPKGAQEPTLRPGRKFSQFRANESKEMANAKALDKASSSSAEGKKKVSLAKAPWEKDKTNEEAEINELDKSTLGSYIKKAHSDKDKQVAKDQYHQAKGDTMDKDDDMYNQWGKANKAAKKAKNRTAGIAKAADKLASENTDLFNKVSDIAYGKWNEALKGGQKKLDHNKNGKIDGHDFAVMRARKKSNEEVDVVETTSSATKSMVTQTGPDGKTRTVNKKIKADRTDDRGQDIIGEATIKTGNMKLKNGKNVKVSNQDAKLLNDFYKNLNAKNRRDMEKVMMKDDAGFKEIVGFAREAL